MPFMFTQSSPSRQLELSEQREYGPSGWLGLHCRHESAVPHEQPPPLPSQHTIPKYPHMDTHESVQLHGIGGRVVLVGGGTGTGAALATMG